MLTFVLAAAPALAGGTKSDVKLADHVLGPDKAPLTIIEYASFSCSHCGTFYKEILPELEKKYIETGKVRFIYRDFPMNRYDLKAAALAHCMPSEQFYPFVKTLFNNAGTWLANPKPEAVLLQYAALGGLSNEKAQACMDDEKMLDAFVERRAKAIKKYDINATPTFIFNDSEDKIIGAVPIDTFTAAIDKILASKK